ncbi:DUF5675 family protein [Campylobacter sp.]|uniref:DUF5675 family protein n=1 Tax=Campylobacter sp. TaxID=205 RepID=UPI0025B86E65|nr:DUF5675 family protein [Campylobacter sp.]
MKKLIIKREELNKTCCIGSLFKVDENEKEEFICYTLEEDLEGIESNKDLRIPSGIYNLDRHIFSSFNESGKKVVSGIKVLNDDDSVINVFNDVVPLNRRILIHWGNTDEDTKGCILLGLEKEKESVKQSRLACKKFYDLMYKKDLYKIKLEIINNF